MAVVCHIGVSSFEPDFFFQKSFLVFTNFQISIFIVESSRATLNENLSKPVYLLACLALCLGPNAKTSTFIIAVKVVLCC